MTDLAEIVLSEDLFYKIMFRHIESSKTNKESEKYITLQYSRVLTALNYFKEQGCKVNYYYNIKDRQLIYRIVAHTQ